MTGDCVPPAGLRTSSTALVLWKVTTDLVPDEGRHHIISGAITALISAHQRSSELISRSSALISAHQRSSVAALSMAQSVAQSGPQSVVTPLRRQRSAVPSAHPAAAAASADNVTSPPAEQSQYRWRAPSRARSGSVAIALASSHGRSTRVRGSGNLEPPHPQAQVNLRLLRRCRRLRRCRLRRCRRRRLRLRLRRRRRRRRHRPRGWLPIRLPPLPNLEAPVEAVHSAARSSRTPCRAHRCRVWNSSARMYRSTRAPAIMRGANNEPNMNDHARRQ